ncbi:hypothetical protein FOC1_g10003122 [Fusarium oxysporum f. sp. cubense race 1]|uniref:Uncharacterized protein n=1 Tax=Fusarium oxysporum f. sp. cubense (strain race 1) TaxID=1229664 RepID=N4UP25_FUSC1|nr:hypothetical protein FOC1_g10003122 [Fusarium oxysporum f. sp. cubense race 1]
MPLNGTSRYAHMRTPAWLNPSPQPPSDAQKERRRPNDALLNDPNSDILIDFNSNQGFYEAAKKKKTKTPSAPPPPPPPPAAPPADDGQKDDNTGGDGGASGGDAAGGAGDGNGDGNSNSPPKPPTTFENINLGDNKPDLGLSPPENKGISSSWGAKLGFGGGIEEDDDGWGFGAKKEKKKGSTLWGAEPDEEPKDGDDPWGWSGQKKKGKAGGILEELALDSDTAPPNGKKDIWDTWGISKKDRAKKKGIMEEVALAAAPDPPSMEDQWGGWSGKKEHSQSSLWGAQDSIPAPAPDPPSFEDKDGDDFWSTFGTGKAKPPPEETSGWGSWGIGKKGEDETKPPKTEDDGWDLWGTGKKKKKAGDLIQIEDDIPPPAPDPVEAVGTDDFLDSWGFGKKPKKPAADPFDFKTSGADDPNDAFWGSIDNKKPNAHEFLIDATGEPYHDIFGEGLRSKALDDEIWKSQLGLDFIPRGGEVREHRNSPCLTALPQYQPPRL